MIGRGNPWLSKNFNVPKNKSTILTSIRLKKSFWGSSAKILKVNFGHNWRNHIFKDLDNLKKKIKKYYNNHINNHKITVSELMKYT